jgi:tetratricopeptide (TPR) repeat protein
MLKPIRVFVSSKMAELAQERKIIAEALEQIFILPWVYEDEAGAQSQSIQQTYSHALDDSDIYLGVFWKGYGHYTVEDEFARAAEKGIPRLIYEKRQNIDERDPKLQNFLDSISGVTDGLTIQRYTEPAELREMVKRDLIRLLTDTFRAYQAREGAPTAHGIHLYQNLAELPRRAFQFIKREDLVDKVQTLIQQHNQLLLVGMGGIGKTTLALKVVLDLISKGQQKILWIELGDAMTETIVDRLRQFAKAKPDLASTLEAGDLSLTHFLNQLQPTLIVLDDVLVGRTLGYFLDNTPQIIPVLVTSRQQFPGLMKVPVESLSINEAVEILSYYYAGNEDYHASPGARALCEALGCHTYAIKIAGSILGTYALSPEDLLAEYKEDLSMLEAPGDFTIEPGQESIFALFELSWKRLAPQTQEVFNVFGSLFAPRASVTLVSACLDRSEMQVKPFLRELVRHSLLIQETSDFLELHALTFAYIRKKNKGQVDQKKLLDKMEQYLRLHAQDFDLLHLDIENLLAALEQAVSDQRIRMVCYLAMGDYPRPPAVGKSSYIETHGHTTRFLRLLDLAISEAEELAGDFQIPLHYLRCKRGNIYFDYGNWKDGQLEFERALATAPDQNRSIKVTAALGVALDALGQQILAESYLEAAQNKAAAIPDEEALGLVLQYRSHVANLHNNWSAVRRFATAAAELHRKLKNIFDLGYDIVNLGAAEHELGNLPQAVALHTEALNIAEQTDNQPLQADALHALAEDYYDLGDQERAWSALHQALKICQETNDIAHAEQIKKFISESFPDSQRL